MNEQDERLDAEMTRLIALGRIKELRPEDQILPEFRFIQIEKSLAKLEAGLKGCQRLLAELERDSKPMPDPPF
jgi:hypothetical protein